MEDQNFSSNLAAWEENKEYKEKVLKLKEDLKRAGQPFEHVDGYLPVGDDVWPPHQASVGACLGACAASSSCVAVR